MKVLVDLRCGQIPEDAIMEVVHAAISYYLEEGIYRNPDGSKVGVQRRDNVRTDKPGNGFQLDVSPGEVNGF
jgi:hypothetical protein